MFGSRKLCALVLALTAGLPLAGQADEAQVARGQYLVGLGGCMDCHTPGYFLGAPDMTRYLGGSDVGFEIPGLGVFYGPNLTPDKETGLGDWTQEQIITAFTTGATPDGTQLAPIMPYMALANLTGEDQVAIAAFLASLPPVKNAVAGPFKPGETVPGFIMRVLPPGQVAQ